MCNVNDYANTNSSNPLNVEERAGIVVELSVKTLLDLDTLEDLSPEARTMVEGYWRGQAVTLDQKEMKVCALYYFQLLMHICAGCPGSVGDNCK